MEILADGSVYLEKGEKMPRKCPVCGAYIVYAEEVVEVECVCGHHGAAAEFEDVEYEMRPVN